jgi:hypothetical protein
MVPAPDPSAPFPSVISAHKVHKHDKTANSTRNTQPPLQQTKQTNRKPQ